LSLLERGGTREEVSRKRRREPGQRENLLFLLLFFSTSFPFSQPLSSLSSTTNLPSPSNSLASALHLRAAASIPSSSRSYAATTLSTSSAPNYFPHLSKSSPASPSVSQARVAGATLRGRDRAPRTSMSDPETVYAAKASSAAQATQPLTSAGTIDPRFSYAFKHHSMSDASSMRGSIAPGIHVFEGSPAVSTADVASPLRHSMAEPEFASAVRTRLS